MYTITEAEGRLLAYIIEGRKQISDFCPEDQELIYELYLKFAKIVKS